jgi:soluble lytic murein transglycosylase-like protein
VVTAIHHDDGGENSVGICQLHISTARWLGFQGTERQLLEPQVNTYYAAKFLAYQIARYKFSITLGVIAYNRGNAIGLTHTEYSDKVFRQLADDYAMEAHADVGTVTADWD